MKCGGNATWLFFAMNKHAMRGYFASGSERSRILLTPPDCGAVPWKESNLLLRSGARRKTRAAADTKQEGAFK